MGGDGRESERREMDGSLVPAGAVADCGCWSDDDALNVSLRLSAMRGS